MSNSLCDWSDQILESDWELLEPHHKRGALFLLDASVKLEVASEALSRDDVAAVTKWLDDQTLRKPTDAEVESWAKEPHKKLAKFVIVQPYVLMQLIPELKH